MSNQVFANQQKKFFPCPGLNAYNLSAPATIATSSNENLEFDTPIIVQASGFVSPASGLLSFDEDGLYSLKAIIGIAPAISDSNVIYDAKMTLTGGYAATGATLDRLKQQITCSTTLTPIIITLSYTGFFNRGDLVTTNIANLGSANAFTCSDTICQLLVCKLA
jgi:hypothetical protein